MKKIVVTLVCLLCLGFTAWAAGEIKQVPFTDVQVKDLFWKQRLDVMRNTTIRYAFQKCTDAGQLRNFEYAGKIVSGEAQVGDLKFQSGNPYDDAEVYKVLEGAAYVLTTQANASLEEYCDGVIVRGVTIDSYRTPRGDAMDMSSTKNVLIEYSYL